MAKISKKSLILTIFILILALVLGGCFTKPQQPGNQNQNINPTPTTTEEIDTSDWKTYRNEEYGFEFRYPTDWALFKIPQTNSIGLYMNGEINYFKDNLNWGDLIIFFNVSKNVLNMFDEGNIGLSNNYVNSNGQEIYSVERYQTGQDKNIPLVEAKIYFFKDKKNTLNYINCRTFRFIYYNDKREKTEVINSELCDKIADNIKLIR